MSTRTATASVRVRVQSTIKNTLTSGAVASSSVGGSVIGDSLASGVSGSQINRVWHITDLSITSGNFRDIDIATMSGEDIGAGTGKDALGQTMDMEEVVALIVKNTAGPGQLEVMASVPGAAPVAWIPSGYASASNAGAIREGGVRAWYEPGTDGLDIELASSNVLRLAANGGDVTAEVMIIGRHDDDESSSSTASSSSGSSTSS